MATRKEIIDIQVQYGTLEGLESQLEQVNQELKQTQIGSEAFNSLTKEAQKLNAAIEGVNNQVAGMTLDDKLFAADGAIKTFAGSVEATVGALGLLGIESEALGAFEEKAASAIALGMGLKDMAEGFGQVAQMAAKAEIATKLFGNTSRAALISTGVGAIVVALGLIVAYWDKISVAIGLATDETEVYAKATENAAGDINTFQENLFSFQTSLRLSREGLISKDEALKQYNETLGKALGNANSLEEAERLAARNAPLYTQLVLKKATAQALLAKAAELNAKIASGEAYDTTFLQDFLAFVAGPGEGAFSRTSQAQKNLTKTQKELKTVFDAVYNVQQDILGIEILLSESTTTVTDKTKTRTTEVKNNTAALEDNLAIQEKIAKFEEDEKKGPAKIAPVKTEKITTITPEPTPTIVTAIPIPVDEDGAEKEAAILTKRIGLYSELAEVLQYVGIISGDLAQIFKEGSKAQRIAAIAEIVTLQAASIANSVALALKVAQQAKTASGLGKVALYLGTLATLTGSVASTFSKARALLKTGDSGSKGAESTSPTSSNFRMQTPIMEPTISPIVRAYVLSGDVRNAIEADAKLSKRRTLG